MIARLHPQPDVPAAVRKLPMPAAAGPLVESLTVQSLAVEVTQPLEPTASQSTPAVPVRTRPPVMSPLAPERYKVQFTVSKETYDKH